MKTRFAAAMLAAVLAATVFAPASEAASSKLYVKVTPGATAFCRAAPDQLTFSYFFKAKITRRNSPNPKRVVVSYRVTDTATGAVIVSQTLVLKPSRSKSRNFYKVGALTQYTAGTNLSVSVKMKFKAPNTGRTIRSSATLPDSVPTVEQLDALNPPLLACAAG